jgi:(E)-4-hydroxy-3-methylbut-2-enyl-diphosphate synthase
MSEIRPWRTIERRKSRQIMVGSVPVGGDAPITVQTMTNTLTSDAVATIDQIRRCEDAGADLIRVSCPDVESTAALGKIVKASRIPIIADIHFHYKRALEAATRARPACASTPATSVRPTAWPKWCARPRPTAAPSASA